MNAPFVSYETTPKNVRRYWSTLLSLMSLKDGVMYDRDHVFTDEHLLTLTPDDVVEFFNLKVYGTPHPDVDATPKLGRSTSLESYKKHISYFMPNRLICWDVQNNRGNPTRSIKVNSLINKIKKEEVRKRGKKSVARRPFELNEFAKLVSMLRADQDPLKKYGYSALVCLQLHFLARIDDTCALMVDEIRAHDTYKHFALRGRMCWSKNVLEERAAPAQIIFGASNYNFCPLLTLALFLELFYPVEKNENGELNLFSAIGKTATQAKQRVGRHLKTKIFNDPEFKALLDVIDELVGSHSIRKFASTHARRSGCSRDDLNVRGRWKRFKQMVDTYVDPDIPYPDAKTAAALAIGGPVKYELLKGSGVDDCWLVENVLPETFKLHPCKKAVVTLSKALLWACFDAEAQELVPLQIIKRVHTAYEAIRKLDTTQNPVRKVPLVVCGHEGQLIIEELFDEDATPDGVGVGGGGGGGAEAPAHDDNNSPATPEALNRRRSRHSSEMQAVFAQLMLLRKQNEELTTEIQSLRTHVSRKITYLSSTVNRLTMVPAKVPRVNVLVPDDSTNPSLFHSPQSIAGHQDGEERPPASLSKNPRSLYTLWHEYEFGIAGRMPAKFFSSRDRGANRYTYSKRKTFWDLVVKMVNRGRSANEAIDFIYRYYGFNQSVSNIIKKLQRERKEGTGYPQFL